MGRKKDLESDLRVWELRWAEMDKILGIAEQYYARGIEKRYPLTAKDTGRPRLPKRGETDTERVRRKRR